MKLAPSLGRFGLSVFLLLVIVAAAQADQLPQAPGPERVVDRLLQSSAPFTMVHSLLSLAGVPQVTPPAGTTRATNAATPPGATPAVAPELHAVRAVLDHQTVTIELEVAGEFTYSPKISGERLLLVDLPGVRSQEPSTSRLLNSELVSSYRVVNYLQGEQPSARLEVLLKQASNIEYRKAAGRLEVLVVPAKPATATSRPALPAGGTATATSVPSSASALALQAPAPPPIEATSRPAPLAATASAPLASAPHGNRLERIALSRGNQTVDVRVITNGSVRYKAFTLSKPPRVVLDIQDVENRVSQHVLVAEGMPPLRVVRVGQFQKQPPITRVVLELEEISSYDVRPSMTGLEVALTAPFAGKRAVPPPAQGATTTTSRLAPFAATPATSRLAPFAATPATSQAPPLGGPLAASVDALFASVRQLMASPRVELAPAPDNSAPQLQSRNATASPAPSSAKGALDSTAPSTQVAAQVIVPRAAAPAKGVGPDVSAAAPAKPVATSPAVPASLAVPATTAAAPVPQSGTQKAPAAAPQAPAAAGGTRYTGEPISINVKDVDLKDFFRLIHEISGLNIVLDPNVRGTVTMVLDDVPWDQALDIVLRNNQLDKVLEGNVLRIATLDTLKREQSSKAELAAAQQTAAERITQTRQMSYAKADELLPTVKKFLSPRADVIADSRTNQLIITDIPQAFPVMDEVLKQLDVRTKQVEIEARVVSASREFVRELGSQFGAAGVTTGGRSLFGGNPVGGNDSPITARPLPSPFTVSGGQAIPLFSNFPAAGANVGFTFAHASPNFALDLILTAAERRGIGKLLSRPKIVTQNNQQGLVQQGVKIPVQTTVNNTVSVQFVDVTLKMTVTPQITAENTIFLKIDVTNSTIDPGIARINGIPALDTQQATTQVLVDDGGTVVFGGVIQNSNNLTIQQVPILGSVPLIGNLFKRTGVSTSTGELLFFITPKIV